ncbi:MAG: hypothetical protein K6T75_05525 [Acetobacteraceae bacterium]|nr:hypothetical protein [Acetobacteraceae bacterium]
MPGGGVPLTQVERAALACLEEADHLTRRAGPWPDWSLARVPFLLYGAEGRCLLVGYPVSLPGFLPADGDGAPGWPSGLQVLPFGARGGGPPGRPPASWWMALDRAVPGLKGFLNLCRGGVLLLGGRAAAAVPLPSAKNLSRPEDLVARMCRQGFRVYLDRWPEKTRVAPNPAYPDLSPVNNALGNLEGQLLYDALFGARIRDAENLREVARTFALIRRERRKDMPEALVGFERSVELAEGLGAYVEIQALARSARSGYRPCPAFSAVAQGGSRLRYQALLGEVREQLRAINLHGAGAGYQRFRFTGMALALLLDRLLDGWKARLADPGVYLDDLLEGQVRFDGGSGDDMAIASAQMRYQFVARLEDEKCYAQQEMRRRQEGLERLLGSRGTRLVFDVSQLEPAGEAWVEAGRERISEAVTVHRDAAAFAFTDAVLCFEGVPVVEDRRQGLLHVCLPEAQLKLLGDGQPFHMDRAVHFTDGLEVECPGISIRARCGTLHDADGALLVRLGRPAEAAGARRGLRARS